MTTNEANMFIEEMEEIGDVWTLDSVMDVYGGYSLQDALAARRSEIDVFMFEMGMILNRR